jgi:hypothetical protein
MFIFPRKTKYPNDDHLEIWNLNRNKVSGKDIANLKNVTPASVSKTLKITNKRIEDLLINAAKSNRITLEYIDPVLGFAKGHHHSLNDTANLTFSPQNGIQIWYLHEGDCANCDIFDECRKILLNEFKARNLTPKSDTLAPTDLIDELIINLEILSESKKVLKDDEK